MRQQDACGAPLDHVSGATTEAAAQIARALCIQAALVTRREADAPAQIIARADVFWAWVSQPQAPRTIGAADPLTERKRSR